MGKLISQFAILVASFFVLWNLFGRVDWMKILHVEQATQTIEEKLGEKYWEIFKSQEVEIVDKSLDATMDKLLNKLCEANKIDRKEIKVHIVDNDEVNAFALPDGHLVVYAGLIRDSQNEAELCGVLAHELAHLELGHLMKKLVKEVGLTVLISMTSGNHNPEMIRQAFKALTSSAFDRDLEREADIKAVDYLVNSDINPEGLANFLYRMASAEKGIPDQLFWLSTHPGGEERSKDILAYVETKEWQEEFVLTEDEWESFQIEIAAY